MILKWQNTMQNTQEKVSLEWVKNSKFLHKRDASVLPHSNLPKIKEIIKS